MITTTPVEAEAFRLLSADLYQHIDEAENLADSGPWAEQDQEPIRLVIHDLVTVVRCLLAHHEPPKAAANRHCPSCNTSWPCPGVHHIHKVLKDPEREFVRLVQARRLGPGGASAGR
jgi:hypothetical protein